MMFKKAFPEEIGFDKKSIAVSMILVVNAFIWYFYAFNFLMEVVNQAEFSDFLTLTIWGINLLGIAISAILSTFLIDKFKRRITFLLCWMLAGVVVSLTPIAIDVATWSGLIIVSAFLGAYFGLGIPVCLGYYAAATEVRNRSRLSGITFLMVGIGFFLLSSIAIKGILLNSLTLAALRTVGVLTLFFLKPDEKQINKKNRVSYGFIFRNKSFLLYFVPWIMFALVNYVAGPVSNKLFPDDLVYYTIIIENILSGVFAVVCGFFADFLGRKRLAVTGFALLGLGYAILGLFPGNLWGLWFYTAVDGIAWGAFYTIFLLTVWGDLAQEQSSEKYYAIGSLPFILSIFMRLSIGAYVTDNVPESAVFSFASVFLFLAVLPLIYAPETLPEKTMKERELKKYVEKAQKEAEKAQKKEAEKTPWENGDDGVEFEANQELEEIQKEVEKYY
jgi:MFS family permease